MTFATLNIAQLAPSPMASDMTAVAVKPGFFHMVRNPYRKSCHKRWGQTKARSSL
jgi:hypothetical protein